MKSIVAALACASLAVSAQAQFDLEESHTSASLRGISSVGIGIAWASGANGTVLRTEDGGFLWQTCNPPPASEKLDFRAIQAFDANTAYIMSSGKGALSRVYKTTDACQSWTLLFTNPDSEGFWDALQFLPRDTNQGFILGDPVTNPTSGNPKQASFVLFATLDAGTHWTRISSKGLAVASPGIGAFAASNSSLFVTGPSGLSFATGGPNGPYVYQDSSTCTMVSAEMDPMACIRNLLDFDHAKIPMSGDSSSAGIFSYAANLVVGGDYTKPNQSEGTAAYFDSHFGGWFAAKHMPHGYRSSVAYYKAADAWIAVGPNGTDISFDRGKNWQPAKPGPGEPAGADQNWNALSLPFVVGANGRIGKLRDNVFKQSKTP